MNSPVGAVLTHSRESRRAGAESKSGTTLHGGSKVVSKALLTLVVIGVAMVHLDGHPAFIEIYKADPYSMDRWLYCGNCHVNPGGGGYGAPLTPFGEAFKSTNMTITPDLRRQFPDRFARVARPAAPEVDAGEGVSVETRANFGFWSIPASAGRVVNVVADAEGFVWLAGPEKAVIASLDPPANRFKEFVVPAVCHDIAVDRGGTIWTLAGSETGGPGETAYAIQHLDPKTSKIDSIATPKDITKFLSILLDPSGATLWVTSADPASLSRLNLETHTWETFKEQESKDPEFEKTVIDKAGGGIDNLGNVWYVSSRFDRIVRFDGAKFAFREYPLSEVWRSEMSGGRNLIGGLALDSSSQIWVALPTLGAVAKLHSGSGDFEKFAVPCGGPSSSGATAVPSDIRVDAKNRVWLNDVGCHSIWMFDPASQEFKRFPIPEDQVPKGEMGARIALDSWGGLWFTGSGSVVGLLNTADY